MVQQQPNASAPPPFVGALTQRHFVRAASAQLDRRAAANAHIFAAPPTFRQRESVFFSVHAPPIATAHYLARLIAYAGCSPAAFVLMLIYVDRVAAAERRLAVTALNVHRLLLAALVVACKFLDDGCFPNDHYARVGGVHSVHEMNKLELQLMLYLHRLFVTPAEYAAKLAELAAVPLEQHHDLHQLSRLQIAAASPHQHQHTHAPSLRQFASNSSTCITQQSFVDHDSRTTTDPTDKQKASENGNNHKM